MTNAQALAIKWDDMKGNIQIKWDLTSANITTIAGVEATLLALVAAKTGYTAARALEEYVHFMTPFRIPSTVSQ